MSEAKERLFPTLEQIKESEWFKGRPPAVQQAILEHPMTQLYRQEDGIFPFLLQAYEEDGDGNSKTVRAVCLSPFMQRSVFGIPRDSLIPIPESAQ